MPRFDLYHSDSSDRAQLALEQVLKLEEGQSTPAISVVPVREAIAREGLYEAASGRNIVRVLFISRDESLLNPTQQTLDGFVQLADLFDEVHILILRTGIPAKYPVLRVAKNVWLYTASSRVWWWTPMVGLRLIHQELAFLGGLRPDLIVAREPYEAALVAYLAGKRYGRPTQLHVREDFTKSDFVRHGHGNRLRRRLARWLIPRFVSVRTESSALQEFLGKQWSIPDLSTLPRFHNYPALSRSAAAANVKSRYPNFSFIMLYVGRLGHESTLYRVLDATCSYLRNPRVGLIVLGDGPAQREFERRANHLGIGAQVVFEREAVDVLAYFKAAHVLIVSDIDGDADDIARQGAVAGIALILARNPFRDDLFVDGESALLFRHDSVEELKYSVHTILNEVALRRSLALTAEAIVLEHFHEDPETYRKAYRASIEYAMFIGQESPVIEAPPSV